jgi:hypothetical protein
VGGLVHVGRRGPINPVPGLVMNRWTVTDPLIFFSVAGLVVAYILYMMIIRRKGERVGFRDRDIEL